ncbi:pentapeptide repeat-containing protein [Streptomyces cyaneofuscatus]|uniref:pentapeptide repeat-containing protein n=1 Tax=Streptomyces cyaneofuscatus TaxID=66883 RepID=UPI0036BCD263
MTSAAPEPPSITPPSWLHCGHAATSADPVGCRGIHVGDHTACLAHLNEADRTAYFAALLPGADIDHRGTPFTASLLDLLLAALLDPTTRKPRIGAAQFAEASFSGDAQFGGVTFSSIAEFTWATFSGIAEFGGATFSGIVRFIDATFSGAAQFDEATFSRLAAFGGATFSGIAWFNRTTFPGIAVFNDATFSRDAQFHRATFSGDAGFLRATFSRAARFHRTTFSGDAEFDGATFSHVAMFDGAAFSSDARFNEATFSHVATFDGATFSRAARFHRTTFSGDAVFDRATFSNDAVFHEARFKVPSRLGPMVCGGQVVLDAAVFEQPVTVEIAARRVSCARTRWASTATLHLRYADLDLRDAVFEYPVLVAARPTPFPLYSANPTQALSETELSSRKPGVRLITVGGVDAAHLALHDIDLSGCRFAGAIHLDQLKVDGWCTFDTTPGRGWGWGSPWRWSRRNVLVEEHHWRVRATRRSDSDAALAWTGLSPDAPELKPAAVAALYRQLRKSLEDGKNEPDAADFYYGECEMRRHDPGRPRGERALLTLYWALSGYGLRAIRALAWLGTAMTVTVALMMLWGLPAYDPKQTTTGRQVAAGQKVVLVTDNPDPVNPTGPLAERVTTERLEKSLRVVINSVIFRSSGQDLTTVGTYTEMTSRLAEPVLLGLAVLAVRSRVKR